MGSVSVCVRLSRNHSLLKEIRSQFLWDSLISQHDVRHLVVLNVSVIPVSFDFVNNLTSCTVGGGGTWTTRQKIIRIRIVYLGTTQSMLQRRNFRVIVSLTYCVVRQLVSALSADICMEVISHHNYG